MPEAVNNLSYTTIRDLAVLSWNLEGVDLGGTELLGFRIYQNSLSNAIVDLGPTVF